MSSNKGILKEKSYQFAIQIVLVSRDISKSSKEFDITRQLLRSGTAIGA